MIKLHWVTRSSILSLLSKFCSSDGFWNILCVGICATCSTSISLIGHNTTAILSRIEILSCHHHKLISIWSLSLILKIKIGILTITTICDIGGSDPATVSNTTISLRWHYLMHVILLCTGIELSMLSSITSFHLVHEISICHSVSHLNLVVLRKFASITRSLESTDFSLIENVWFALNCWKHVVDSGIVCGLKHDTIMSCIHFIDA